MLGNKFMNQRSKKYHRGNQKIFEQNDMEMLCINSIYRDSCIKYIEAILQDRIDNPKDRPSIYQHLDYNKSAIAKQWGKSHLFNNKYQINQTSTWN